MTALNTMVIKFASKSLVLYLAAISSVERYCEFHVDACDSLPVNL